MAVSRMPDKLWSPGEDSTPWMGGKPAKDNIKSKKNVELVFLFISYVVRFDILANQFIRSLDEWLC